MEEITAEYATSDLIPQVEFTHRPVVTVGCKTDMGRVRENNEDKFEYFLPESPSELASKGLVFIVCDGMGGHEAGQIASELSCKTFIDVYRNHPSTEPSEAARAAVGAANRFVLDVARAIPSRRGMGTTLTALLLVQQKAIIAQVGDSRLYHLRTGECRQVTVDHTWVEETVAAGLMPREQAEQHQYRHVITRAIGTDQNLQCDIFELNLLPGDVFMLCSDGVTNHVSNEEIGKFLRENTPSEAAWRLVGAALTGGGSDNATSIVVRVDDVIAVE